MKGYARNAGRIAVTLTVFLLAAGGCSREGATNEARDPPVLSAGVSSAPLGEQSKRKYKLCHFERIMCGASQEEIRTHIGPPAVESVGGGSGVTWYHYELEEGGLVVISFDHSGWGCSLVRHYADVAQYEARKPTRIPFRRLGTAFGYAPGTHSLMKFIPLTAEMTYDGLVERVGKPNRAAARLERYEYDLEGGGTANLVYWRSGKLMAVYVREEDKDKSTPAKVLILGTGKWMKPKGPLPAKSLSRFREGMSFAEICDTMGPPMCRVAAKGRYEYPIAGGGKVEIEFGTMDRCSTPNYMTPGGEWRALLADGQ